jgi:enoyl-CoA hydratase/carnithine racemase
MQACDIVVVADDAIIGDQHANFGLIPGGGGSQRLPRLVGRQRALALLLTGHRLSGLQAVAWGLAYRSVPSAALREQSSALASEMASKSLDGLTTMKRLVDEGSSKSLPDAIECEVETFLTWLEQPDACEGLQAFREKRVPQFR